MRIIEPVHSTISDDEQALLSDHHPTRLDILSAAYLRATGMSESDPPTYVSLAQRLDLRTNQSGGLISGHYMAFTVSQKPGKTKSSTGWKYLERPPIMN